MLSIRLLSGRIILLLCCFFFFNDTATTEIYTLSLHDALPIWNLLTGRDFFTRAPEAPVSRNVSSVTAVTAEASGRPVDRKSTRLNSSHDQISYAVFCLKKKKNKAIATLTMLPRTRSSIRMHAM